MGLERIVGIGKSAYQTSKKFVRNPRAYFVAPLAFAAALSFSGRSYAGTIYDPILDGILNSGGAFTIISEIPPEDELPGMIRFRTNTPPFDVNSIYLPNTTGELDCITKWDPILTMLYINHQTILRNPTDTQYKIDVGTYKYDGGSEVIYFDYYDPTWHNVSEVPLTAQNAVWLRFKKYSDNSIEGFYKQDYDSGWSSLGVYNNGTNLTSPILSSATGVGEESILRKVFLEGPNVPDIYNDAIELNALSKKYLFSLILSLSLLSRKKIKRQMLI